MVPMLVVGLQGSPRKKGSSDYLLKHFLRKIERTGAEVQILDIPRMNIRACIGCGHCEKKGFCIIDDDDMAASIYPLLRKAQVVVAVSPVYFYSVTSQLKALIDRTQVFWSRKYRFRLSDPLSTTRKGFFLSMGGSQGKKLFNGIHLIAAYFFDAIDADYSGSLTYPGIETAADFENMPDLDIEISRTAHALMSSLCERKRILFLGKHDDIRIQMAAALTQYHAGNRYHVVTSENESSRKSHPGVVKAMAEIGIDMAFHQTPSLSNTLQEYRPDMVVAMDNDIEIPAIPNVTTSVWNLPNPQNASSEVMGQLRKQIHENVTKMTTDR
jgi:multimeric flavodoxin WrbA